MALVGHWRFDGAATDASGNGYTATLVGSPTYVGGRFGDALALNGSTQRAEIPAGSAALNSLGSAFSISQWFRAANTSGLKSLIARTGSGGYEGVSLYLNGNALNWILRTTGSGKQSVYGFATVTASAWHHVVLRYDNATTKVYLNNAEVSSLAQTGGISVDTGNPWGVGAEQYLGAWHDPFNGQIDDVRIYNHALSAADIGVLYSGEVSLAASQSLGALTGSAALTAVNGLTAGQSLGALTGSAALTAVNGLTASQSLGALTGVAAIGLPVTMSAAQALGGLSLIAQMNAVEPGEMRFSGAAEVVAPISVQASAQLGSLTGSASLTTIAGVTATQTMGAVIAAGNIVAPVAMTAARTLGGVAGSAAITAPAALGLAQTLGALTATGSIVFSYPPSLPFAGSSRAQSSRGRTVSPVAGFVRAYDAHAVSEWTLEILHPHLEPDQVRQLHDFYMLNRLDEFVLTYPLDPSGQPHDYLCAFVGEPEFDPVSGFEACPIAATAPESGYWAADYWAADYWAADYWGGTQAAPALAPSRPYQHARVRLTGVRQ
jgi:hypothetical protein